VIFKIFAPLKTTIGGLEISFASLDNPVKISLFLILVGIFFRYSDNKFSDGSTFPNIILSFLFFLVYLSSI
jgi:hypothetical protein